MDPIWPAKACRLGDKVKPFLDFGDSWNEFTMFLGRFGEDEEIEVIVRKKQKASTNAQNRYYWGVIVKIISDYTGHTPDEIHSRLKWMFLKFTDEKGIEYARSTTDLTTKQREQYHEDCRRWGAVVLALSIPLPNEATGE